MNQLLRRAIPLISFLTLLAFAGCSTPTLLEVTRRRSGDKKNDVTVKYTVTDWDVLNFTDEVKRKLNNRSNLHTGLRYGAAGTQSTLGALAGAVSTFGWSAATASGLGVGATYIFGMGQIFDSKAHAQAYEQAYTQIQAAEASYYFHMLGMDFTTDSVTGKRIADPTRGAPSSQIPPQTSLTPAGETLYYRTTKILKVLGDALVSKIPDLEDLKDANGEATASGSPALQKTSGAPNSTRPPNAYQDPITKSPVYHFEKKGPDIPELRRQANKLHTFLGFVKDEDATHILGAGKADADLAPEFNAHPQAAGQSDLKYLYDLTEKAVTDPNGAVYLKKWSNLIPAHALSAPPPLPTGTPPAGGTTTPGKTSNSKGAVDLLNLPTLSSLGN